MLLRYLRRFPHPLHGLFRSFVTDFSFRTQVYLGLVVLGSVAYWWQPLSKTELLFLVLGWLLVLITELQNSALEHALDQLHPGKSEAIGRSKDISAAAVLLAGLFLLLVVLLLGADRLDVATLLLG